MIEELYTSCHEELVKWCKGMCQDLSLAEDLVHEGFFRAMKNAELLDRLDFRQRRAWMYRTIKNLYVDHVRHKAFEYSCEFEQAVSERDRGRQTGHDVLYYDQMEYIQADYEQLLDSLPEGEGVLLAMRYLYGYNSKELGQILGLEPATVRARLSVARKHMRTALEGII